MTYVYHVLTPGDHYSPRTGSAIPTVVHGLATGAARVGDIDFVQRVVIQGDTFHPRYPSAELLEYAGVPPLLARERYIDGALARLGRTRRGAVRQFVPAVERLRHEAPGIVVAHNAPVVAQMLRGTQHRTVLYAHNDVLRSYGRGESVRVVGATDRVVAVSEFLAEAMQNRLPTMLRERLRVVGNGVDTDVFHPRTQRAPGPIRIMALGRTIPDKGADVLLSAAALVPRSEVEYVVVGSHGFDPDAPLSPFERRLRLLAESVPAPVRFERFVDREALPELLRGADILVVPSRWAEPWALTVGEGLATGLVTIASRVGGIPEALGGAGILFDPSQPEELASALTFVIDHPEERTRLGAHARRSACVRNWDRAWTDFATVLKGLVLAE